VRYANGAPGPSGIMCDGILKAVRSDCQTREGGKCQFNVPSNGVYMSDERESYKDVSSVELMATRGLRDSGIAAGSAEAPSEAPAAPGRPEFRLRAGPQRSGNARWNLERQAH